VTPVFRNHLRVSGLLVLLFLALLNPGSVASQRAATAARLSQPATTLSSVERKATNRVRLQTIREITTRLTDKEFEGRGTAQPGADRAAAYLAQRFAAFGLKPLGDNGTFLQPLKFRIAEVSSATTVKVGNSALVHGEDYVLLPPYQSEQLDITGSVVFAGYGVASQELSRDDFAGLDLKGKVVIVLGGQPQGVDMTLWRRATNAQARAMNVFGRGAAAMIVANAGTTAQPFATIANYLSRRRVSLASAPSTTIKVPPVLLFSDGAMEKVLAGSEMTYAQALEKAKTGAAVSTELGKTASLALRVNLGEATSSNVVGVLEGSDPKLKDEAVVYSAHYDAYGIDSRGRIYPGAADNALGTATITAIAEGFAKAFAKPRTRPRRSIIFLAVTGEEYGLYGAEHWVRSPTWPLDKVAANINFDGIGTEVYGPVKRVVGFGAEHSDLGATLENVAQALGTVVTPDPMPAENAFVRSDHYAFVKKGVPALMLMGGPEGDLSTWLPRMKKWIATDYHSESDTIKPDWDWTGPHTLAQVGMVIGLRVANADAMPNWLPSSQFNKPRVGN